MVYVIMPIICFRFNEVCPTYRRMLHGNLCVVASRILLAAALTVRQSCRVILSTNHPIAAVSDRNIDIINRQVKLFRRLRTCTELAKNKTD